MVELILWILGPSEKQFYFPLSLQFFTGTLFSIDIILSLKTISIFKKKLMRTTICHFEHGVKLT